MSLFNRLFIQTERLLHPKIKEGIAKSLVYYFTIKESFEYFKPRYQGHAHLFDAMPGLLNFAHRGFSGLYPENTLLAFEKALEENVDGIELDVQLSADGTIVVCHDAQLDRLNESSDFVRDLSYQELQKRDIGAWMGEAYQGLSMPTLAEVFECIPNTTLINVEIKHEATSFFNWETEKAVLQLIQTYQREQQVVLSAFNPMVVNRIRKLAPELSVSYLITQTLNPFLIFLLGRVRAPYLHVDIRYLNPKVMARLKAKGLPVLSYTLNTNKAYQSAQKLGLKGIFTDYPNRLNSFMQSASPGTRQNTKRKILKPS